MITKAQVKHIRSLENKKSRLELNEFVVEGVKMLDELLKSKINIKQIFATGQWIERNEPFLNKRVEVISCNQSELERISFLSTPNEVLALCELPSKVRNELKGVALVLDSVQDPGNMGSIIRIADWYGISSIYVNKECADAFSPKVVQASMGGVFRIHVLEENLEKLLTENRNKPIVAALLKGENVNNVAKMSEGFIVMGNESKGISDALIKLANLEVTIPKLGEAESLNVAIATGIICHVLLS